MSRSGCLNIETGTVIDYDASSGAGLIEGDDGRIVLLRATDIIPMDVLELTPGRCVQFVEEDTEEGARAVVLTILNGPVHREYGRRQLRVH